MFTFLIKWLMYINSHTYKKITAHTLSTISQIVYPLQMKMCSLPLWTLDNNVKSALVLKCDQKKIRLMNNQPIATLKNLLKQQDLILAELLGFYLSMFIMLWWVVANWLIFCIWLQGASFCNFMKKYPTECLNVMKSHIHSLSFVKFE